MIQQTVFTLKPRSRGFHLVTDEILRMLPALPQTGLLNLFIQHTSAALSINENADPDVRVDMESIPTRFLIDSYHNLLVLSACACTHYCTDSLGNSALLTDYSAHIVSINMKMINHDTFIVNIVNFNINGFRLIN